MCKECRRGTNAPRLPKVNADPARLTEIAQTIEPAPPVPQSRLRQRLRAARAAERNEGTAEYAGLIAEVAHRAEISRSFERSFAASATDSLMSDPLGPHDDNTADQLYAAWTRILKQDPDLADRLDEQYPILDHNSNQQFYRNNLFLSQFDGYEDLLNDMMSGVIG